MVYFDGGLGAELGAWDFFEAGCQAGGGAFPPRQASHSVSLLSSFWMSVGAHPVGNDWAASSA